LWQLIRQLIRKHGDFMLQRATADGAESADVGLSAGAWCLGDAGLSSLANRRQVASLFDRIEKERNAAARELAPPREAVGGLYTMVDAF
jgi:hypothetical protein